MRIGTQFCYHVLLAALLSELVDVYIERLGESLYVGTGVCGGLVCREGTGWGGWAGGGLSFYLCCWPMAAPWDGTSPPNHDAPPDSRCAGR